MDERLKTTSATSHDRLVDAIVNLAREWAQGDPQLLREAERILAKTEYLGEPEPGEAENNSEESLSGSN